MSLIYRIFTPQDISSHRQILYLVYTYLIIILYNYNMITYLLLSFSVSEIQGCGFSSHEDTGVIKSQNWPMNYKANTECMWNIAAPSGEKITLNFTHFDLEAKDFITSKCYDNIMVYDINSSTNALNEKHGAFVCDWLIPKLFIFFMIDYKIFYCIYISTCMSCGLLYLLFQYILGPFCGTMLPPSIQTTGDRLVIRFSSDLFTESKGFRAYWTTNHSLPAPTEPPTQPNPWDNITIGGVSLWTWHSLLKPSLHCKC